jgi:hypothetical protein
VAAAAAAVAAYVRAERELFIHVIDCLLNRIRDDYHRRRRHANACLKNKELININSFPSSVIDCVCVMIFFPVFFVFAQNRFINKFIRG